MIIFYERMYTALIVVYKLVNISFSQRERPLYSIDHKNIQPITVQNYQ